MGTTLIPFMRDFSSAWLGEGCSGTCRTPLGSIWEIMVGYEVLEELLEACMVLALCQSPQLELGVPQCQQPDVGTSWWQLAVSRARRQQKLSIIPELFIAQCQQCCSLFSPQPELQTSQQLRNETCITSFQGFATKGCTSFVCSGIGGVKKHIKSL